MWDIRRSQCVHMFDEQQTSKKAVSAARNNRWGHCALLSQFESMCNQHLVLLDLAQGVKNQVLGCASEFIIWTHAVDTEAWMGTALLDVLAKLASRHVCVCRKRGHAESSWNRSGPKKNSLAHEGSVTAILPTADGKYWLTAGTDSRLRLWDSDDHRSALLLLHPICLKEAV